MRLRWWLLATYLALLLASHAVRRSAPATATPVPSVEVEAIGAPSVAQPVRLAFKERPGPGPTLLLLHGSPGSSSDFTRLTPLLDQRFRVIAPDLPGFGASPRDVPDYSIRAHADYARQLLDRLDVERAHVLGFSMGGGVALELADSASDRVASVSLLASIGAQEFELLGSYHINHAIHAAQLGALVALHEAVPHFGVLDGFPLDRAYARNFFDTDQRPLRAILERLEPPTLILHGETDPLVPVAAAYEHHRLVPQSELAALDTDHFTVFRDPAMLVGPLEDFIDRVEAGEAYSRTDAEPSRLAAAAEPFDPETLPRAVGLTRVVWILLLAVATLVSEDLTCISAGLLVAQGRFDLFTAIFACALGIFVGDLGLFAVGRFGRRYLAYAPFRWFISEAALDTAAEWFHRRGAIVVFLSRFTPGLRLPTYVAAGLLRTPFLRFAFFFALAVAAWTPILVGVSAIVGEPALDWIANLPGSATLALPLLVLLLWIAVALLRGLSTWRGRRLLLGRWRRWRKWEFWPAWLFYLPVVLRIVQLGLRHRSFTLFTAANPAIPDGGFVGESKRAILERLPETYVAKSVSLAAELEPGQRRQRVESFLAEHGLALPLVLKPDVGERGRQVRIVSSWEEIDHYFESANGETLVQEYVPGVELGVFYVRRPEEPRGRIFSITEKRLIGVEGDGQSSLERLILADDRAVCMAPTFLRRHRAHLARVPNAGEDVRLVDVGTHCRGALFLDGQRYHSEELEAAIDRISRPFEGFYFGRYDLRAPDEAALRAGRDLRVLELNGVTSEATHIYDPKHSLLHAYRVLFEQWRLAFEIGAENRRRGVRPTSLAALIRIAGGWLTSRNRREPSKTA